MCDDGLDDGLDCSFASVETSHRALLVIDLGSVVFGFGSVENVENNFRTGDAVRMLWFTPDNQNDIITRGVGINGELTSNYTSSFGS